MLVVHVKKNFKYIKTDTITTKESFSRSPKKNKKTNKEKLKENPELS